MPTVYIDEETFTKFVEKYGYENAREEIAKFVRANAPKVK